MLVCAYTVVRGGAMHAETLVRAARTAERETGHLAISVYSADQITTERGLMQSLRTSGVALPHTQVRFSTRDRIRNRGFELAKTGGPLHYDIRITPKLMGLRVPLPKTRAPLGITGPPGPRGVPPLPQAADDPLLPFCQQLADLFKPAKQVNGGATWGLPPRDATLR